MNKMFSNCRARLLLVTLFAAFAALPAVGAQKPVGIEPPPQRNDTIGTATGTLLSSCPSDPEGVAGNCWGLNVACPYITRILPYDATLKVTSPLGTSLGTVIFLTGGGGKPFYDTVFTYGAQIVKAVVTAGFTAVQVIFDNPKTGWLSGPALDGNGPLSLACLPATSMQWVYTNILVSGTPLCATGNSSGASAIAYALAHYGLGSMFSMVESTSGPEFTRLDYGCSPSSNPKSFACALCGSGMLSQSFGTANAETDVDPAYTGVVDHKPDGPCSEGIGGSTMNASLFHHDSILSDTDLPTLSYPTTDIHLIFGDRDLAGGPLPQGLDWISYVTSANTIVCLPGVGHMMGNYKPGATQIQNDLITFCKLQPTSLLAPGFGSAGY